MSISLQELYIKKTTIEITAEAAVEAFYNN